MKVVIYTQNNCQFTPQEKNYLASKGVTFEERNVETNKGYLDEMMKLGSNFAGTPVTQIVKDDGSSTVLKGFTQTEFDAALGGAPVAAANADMTMPQAPVDQPVAPATSDVAPVASDAMPPAPEPTPAPMPEPAPAPMPEPTPAPVVETPTPVEPSTDANALADKAVQTANADMTMPQAPVDQPVMPPMPEPTPTPAPEPTPAPMPEPAPAPMPEPTPAPVVETPAPVEPEVQTANADMTMPQAPVDQPVAPATSDVAPVASDAMPAAPEPTTPPTPEATADKAVQTANNPLDAILADLQQKVSATTPTVQSANADMTMPAAPVDQPVTPPTPEPAPVPSPEPTPVPAVDMPTPATSDVAPSADLPNVPDFPAK